MLPPPAPTAAQAPLGKCPPISIFIPSPLTYLCSSALPAEAMGEHGFVLYSVGWTFGGTLSPHPEMGLESTAVKQSNMRL